jgi:hypothetical protein
MLADGRLADWGNQSIEPCVTLNSKVTGRHVGLEFFCLGCFPVSCCTLCGLRGLLYKRVSRAHMWVLVLLLHASTAPHHTVRVLRVMIHHTVRVCVCVV